MKPLKLVLSAFGSYGGCECVDFDKMQQGLFLITGDTGAGKTTIFDGISYALYGQTSGRRRDGDMMRSQYAKDTEETYVEFTFEEGKKIYTIRRSPNWMRRSKRKNKEGEYALTKVSAKVELILPDGALYPGKMKETDQKIVEIIGMDMNQFSQVSMISQGDFMKLLLASSKERKEIFSKIFPTEIYWKIQMELKNQERQLFGRLENIRSRCRNEIENVQCIQDSIYVDEWQEKGGFSEIDNTDILTLLEKMNSEAIESEKDAQKSIEKIENVLEWYRKMMDVTKRHCSLILDGENLEKEIQKLELTVTAEQKLLEQTREQYKKSWEEKQSCILRIRQDMPEFDRLEEEQNAWKQAEAECIRYASGIKKCNELLETYASQLTQIQNQQEELKDSGVHKVEVEQLLSKCTEEYQRMKKLLEKKGPWEQGMKQLSLAKEQLEKQWTLYQQASAAYEKMYERFIASQAGIMAKTLEEGKPCPVCGSLHHPQPHQMSNPIEMVDQKMVEEAKMVRDKANDAVESARERHAQLLEKAIAYKHAILQEASHYFENVEEIFASGQFWKDIEDQLEAKKEQGTALTRELKIWANNVLTYEKNIELLQQLEKKHKEVQDNLQLGIQKEAVLQTQKTQHEKMTKTLLEKLPFASKKEAEQQASKLEEELSASKAQLERQEKQLEQEKQNLSLKQGQWKERKVQAEQTEKEAVKAREAYNKKARVMELSEKMTEAQLEQMKKTLMQKEKHIYGIRQSNQHIYKHLKDMLAQYKDEQGYFAKVRNLSRVANGDVPGAAKIDFQTYMQRRYFKQMVHAANRRLAVMSRNQFLLECRDMNQLGKQGEVGLDLDVYSLVNDQIRDIKTLSGGESFMAALALALGMADVIQQEAGKIHVDTLFIDEGFGSLDDNSRNQAVQILGDLAGSERLVGIISHVHELKEQIEQKIQVEKTEHGSRIITCYSE